MRWLGLFAVAIVIGMASSAHADDIDVRVKQLSGNSAYKLRLSAALWLAKKRDSRAIKALAKALEKDSGATVRQVAAKALGELVDATTRKRARRRAIKALERAVKRESNDKVRAAAERSLERLEYLGSSGPRVLVVVGKPSLGRYKVPSIIRRELEGAVHGVVKTQQPGFLLAWPSGSLPTKSELERSKTRAYYVAVKLAELEVGKKGGKTVVSCAVTLRVNPWEGTDGKERWAAHQTASATGKGKVIGSATSRGIANAKVDCILAVAEQIAAKQVIPFIQRVAGK